MWHRKFRKRFPNLNLSACSIQRLALEYRTQCADQDTAAAVDLSRKRDQCGGGAMKLMEEIAKKLIDGNDRNLGNFSCKKTGRETN